MEDKTMININLEEYKQLLQESTKLKLLLNYLKTNSTLSYNKEYLTFSSSDFEKVISTLFPYEYYLILNELQQQPTQKESVE